MPTQLSYMAGFFFQHQKIKLDATQIDQSVAMSDRFFSHAMERLHFLRLSFAEKKTTRKSFRRGEIFGGWRSCVGFFFFPG